MLKMVFVALMGIFALGCSSSTTAPVATVTPNEAFHQVIDENAPTVGTAPDAVLEDFADAVCEGLDNGLPVEAVFQLGFNNGMSPNEVGTLVGASIAYQCPEYETLLDSGSSV